MNLNETPLFTLGLINVPVNQTNYFLPSQEATKTQVYMAADYSTIEKVDIIGDMKSAWDNFIESGQVWALLIGLFIGYGFRSMTSF
jgi:hypothetical protein